jgi:hypothetical protein
MRKHVSRLGRRQPHFPRELAELALVHKLRDATQEAYRRGDALEKRAAHASPGMRAGARFWPWSQLLTQATAAPSAAERRLWRDWRA